MIFSRRLARLLKILLLVCSVFFLVTLLQNADDSGTPRFDTSADLLHTYNASSGAFEAVANQNSGTFHADLAHQTNFSSPLEQKTIVESIEFINANHKVLNLEKFGAITPDSVSVVIVVQVHNRPEYLRFLIESLRNTRDINQTLIVFSHDMHVEENDLLIQNITFCRVIQINYPYNIQLFPNIFPGQDPNDCPEKISKAQAEKLQCNNYQHPDKYGNYRVAKLTQIKHHWWWKMNYVFDGIVKRYGLNDKYVLLLEEDHYVSPDALYVLDMMIKDRTTICPDCEVLCLGVYLKTYKNYANDISKLSVQLWFSSKHNMGFAFNSHTWDRIRNCSKLFCEYDDYNWDWSLLQVSVKCMNPRMRTIVTKASRVFHIGDCGVHVHKCQAHNSAKNAKEIIENNAHSLFPPRLDRGEITKRTLKPSKPNGSWGDARDHALCTKNTYPYNKSQQRTFLSKENLRSL